MTKGTYKRKNLFELMVPEGWSSTWWGGMVARERNTHTFEQVQETDSD